MKRLLFLISLLMLVMSNVYSNVDNFIRGSRKIITGLGFKSIAEFKDFVNDPKNRLPSLDTINTKQEFDSLLDIIKLNVPIVLNNKAYLTGDNIELTNIDDVAFSKEESKQMIEEAKRNYSNFYSEGMSDEEFLNNVSKELNDRAKVTDKLFSMNITGYDVLSRLSLKSDKQFTKKGSNKTYSLGDIYKQFQDEKTTHLYSKESPMFDDDLNIVIQGAKNDELYVMKPSEGVHKYYADNNKFLRGLENDDNITPEEMNEIRNTVIDLPGLNTKISFDFNKPEGKTLQKEVIMYYPDSTTPEGYKAVKMPLKQFIEVTYKNAAQTAIFAQQTTPNE